MLGQIYKSLNSFSVYGNDSKPLHTNYEHGFSLPFESLDHSMEVTLVLQRYWHWSIYLSIFYYFSIRLLERAMHGRKAFELRAPLLLWNSSLALFSLVALVRFSEDPIHQFMRHGLVHTICYSCHPTRVSAFWAFLFLVSKVVEMGDTVFLALKKRPIIFLHFYHHMAVLVCSTHVGECFSPSSLPIFHVNVNGPSGADNAAPAMLFIPVNFLVHVFMYSYYALMAAGVKVPRWCAMAITSMQILQMLCGVALTALVLKLKIIDQTQCQQSYGNLSLMVFLYCTFAILFSNLFYDYYLKKGGKKRAMANGTNGTQQQKKKKL